MFRIIIQNVDKKGNYETVKSITLDSFISEVADKAYNKAQELSAKVQMYISHSDPVPAGYASRKLQYCTVIWKQIIVSKDDAMSMLDSI